MHTHPFRFFAFVFTACALSALAHAANIDWPEGEYDNPLATDPVLNKADSFFYAGGSIDNLVTVGANYYSIPGNAYGGVSATGVVSGNTLYSMYASMGGAYGGASTTYDVTDNSVYVGWGTVSGKVVGGTASSGAVLRNTVTVERSWAQSDVYGGASDTGTVSANAVTLTSSVVSGGVYGGASASGLVSDNTVTISGGTVQNSVYGGSTTTGSATGNAVAISDGAEVMNYIFGGASAYGAATGNTAALSGGTVWGSVYGGMGATTVSNNAVSVSGTTVYASVYGGYSNNGAATGNRATISSGTITGLVYGGYSVNATASGNTVAVSGGTISGAVTGGTGVTAADNTVTVSGGTLGSAVYGGNASNGTASGNVVVVTGGSVGVDSLGSIIGGYATRVNGPFGVTGEASDNAVTIAGATLSSVVYGGYCLTGNVQGNAVTVSSGAVYGAVFGGRTATGSALSNSVAISGGTLNEKIVGGYSQYGEASGNAVTISGGASVGVVMGGQSVDGTVSGNAVVISGGFVSGVEAGSTETGAALNNTVNLSNGTVNNTIVGGASTDGTVSGNVVTISGGTANDSVSGASTEAGLAFSNGVYISGGTVTGEVFGASSVTGSSLVNTVVVSGGTLDGNLFGGSSSLGAASGNAVTLAGGTVSGMIVGGISIMGEALNNTVTISGGFANTGVIGGLSQCSAASGNTVNLTGGTVTGMIVGGYVATGTATGNTVNIYDTANVAAAAVSGGYAVGASTDLFTGNTLNLHGQNISVTSVANFENYNFYLPTAIADGDTVLSVTGASVDLTGTTVNVGVEGGSSVLQAGDAIVLIDSTNGITGAMVNSSASGTGMQGVTLVYDFDLAVVGDQLVATVQNTSVNEATQALSEGFLAGTAVINQGGDLVAGQTLNNAVYAAQEADAKAAQEEKEQAPGQPLSEKGKGGDWAVFTGMGGGTLRYDTGSHVDIDGFSIVTGLAKGANVPAGRLTVGAFFEYGYGSYDTYNSFASNPNVRGNGSNNYLGGGVLGRLDFKENKTGHFYGEASFRAGSLANDYASSDIGGVPASYDSNSPYYGLHVGAGYVWKAREKLTLDSYAKFFWTHQNGDSVTLSTGDPLSFDSITSTRVRIGTRLNYALNTWASVYAGAAWEYEFDGDANATTNGFSIVAPSLVGGTGIGELGVIARPFKGGKAENITLGLGVQGLVGEQNGVLGSGQIRYSF